MVQLERVVISIKVAVVGSSLTKVGLGREVLMCPLVVCGSGVNLVRLTNTLVGISKGYADPVACVFLLCSDPLFVKHKRHLFCCLTSYIKRMGKR